MTPALSPYLLDSPDGLPLVGAAQACSSVNLMGPALLNVPLITRDAVEGVADQAARQIVMFCEGVASA